MNYTNQHNIPLGLALWLVNDEYDYQEIPNYLSATTLLKPTRQLLLAKEITEDSSEPVDISAFIASRVGTAIHDSIEKAWVSGDVKGRLQSLGIPPEAADKVVVNPPKGTDLTDIVPVFLEQRGFKKVGNYTIGGKFDLCIDGALHDVKTTSVYSYLSGSKDEDYMLQGSIYRWLFPELIVQDYIRILFIFTDWQACMVGTNPNYPKTRTTYVDIPLMSIADTHKWITNKIKEIDSYKDKDISEYPLCSPEDLWLTEPVFKYYSDKNKTSGRATKNFTELAEARAYAALKDPTNKGCIISFEATPKRCSYCNVATVCTQKDKYFK